MKKKDSRMLIVDDNSDDAIILTEMIREGLQDARPSIDRACSVSEAISLAEGEPYDLFFIDYRLGESDGLALMRHLRGAEVRVPIIFLTGEGDEKLAVSAMKEGATDYLSKRTLTPELVSHTIHYGLELFQAEAERREVAAALRESEQMYRSIVETTSEGFWLLNQDLVTIDLNDALCQTLRYKREEIIGKRLSEFIDKASGGGEGAVDGMDQIIRAHLASHQQAIQTAFKTKDGKLVHAILNVRALGEITEKPPKVFAFLSDVTKLKKAEAELEYLAHFDALTGLPNRLLGFDRLEQAIIRTTRNAGLVAILYIDLDHFKAVNDIHGHDAGDRVLKETAKRLTEAVRSSDTVARLGGDEFLTILPKISRSASVTEIAEKMIQMFSKPFDIDDGHSCNLGISIGVSLAPVDGSDSDILLRKADDAMYEAKRSGGACFQFCHV